VVLGIVLRTEWSKSSASPLPGTDAGFQSIATFQLVPATNVFVAAAAGSGATVKSRMSKANAVVVAKATLFIFPFDELSQILLFIPPARDHSPVEGAIISVSIVSGTEWVRARIRKTRRAWQAKN
jgi:hypothetical protein